MTAMQYTVGLRQKVSLVVLMLDALRDVPVPAVRVSIEPEHGKAVVRPDGFHVFVNLPDGPLEVIAQAPGYGDVRFTVDPADLPPLAPVVRERMARDRAQGAAWLRGRVVRGGEPLPGARVVMQEGEALKLLDDAPKGGDRLRIFNPAGRYLGGAAFALCEGDRREDIRLLDRTGDDEYELSAPLEGDFGRGKARLYRLHDLSADADGAFRWPLSVAEECAVRLTAYGPDGEASAEVTVSPGCECDAGDIALPAPGGKAKRK